MSSSSDEIVGSKTRVMFSMIAMAVEIQSGKLLNYWGEPERAPH